MRAAPHIDVIVAMNAQTYTKDMNDVRSGGWLIYDSTWPRSKLLNRKDINVVGVPLARMANENFDGTRARVLMKNIAYVGVLAALLEIDLEIINELLGETFAKETASRRRQPQGHSSGLRLCDRKISPARCPKQSLHMDETSGHIMIDGNTAAGLGCVYAGATVGAWYPITPSTSLMDGFKKFCEKLRVDPDTGEKQLLHYSGRR